METFTRWMERPDMLGLHSNILTQLPILGPGRHQILLILQPVNQLLLLFKYHGLQLADLSSV